ncbi:MAG: nucleoside monophosphate kinase [Candidatus Nanoarchaeia archaeon]|nr:nucleoside monophosphate kinase [Candidatus Haiyanarchaeum thermophilum]MCW1303412.1 nucleoside monophosphate kinase [Candidatus Haiyanarchaeum thermophilum]MCW1303901.1 nucleoside monophosphate kinase [Candidatus Haiyanarchaeum thermophilum]MCW1306887.1 nucleoside monophosphate kinase [Candidatus Haiyanarchaeum thermophilum]MCW1307438.1 nucleoside monophosphate kinase [Candidatus Haiyanarchaeum thermophilum]
MRVIIFGAPGSGKGTYASRLQSMLGLQVIAMGDIFREMVKENTPLGRQVREYVEKGVLVPDEIVIQVLRERLTKLRESNGFILDGFPRTLEQAKALEELGGVDVVIQLDVPEDIIVERLTARRICERCNEIFNLLSLKPKEEGKCDKCGGSLYQRPDDTPGVIRRRIEIYEEQTKPIIQFFKEKGVPFINFKCESINTPPEVGVNHILAELKRLGFIK